MAPKKRRANVKLFNPIINENQITFESALCPVCRSVLIEPVTLPCGHNFCLECFNGTVNNAALVCPLCRTRISSWLRQARKESNLVNIELWKIIQKKYPTYIDTKLKGNDDCFENNITSAPRILATPGEIKQEYEKQVALETDQLRREREAEEQKSKELILELQKQEQLAAQLEVEKLKQDEEIARKIAQEEQEQAKILTQNNITPKNRKYGPMDTFILKSGEIKCQTPRSSPPMRKSLFNNSQNVFQMFSNGLTLREKKQYLLNESVDYMKHILSKENDDVIQQEITHIKPISLVPRTPPKYDKNGIIMESPIIRSTPIRLVQDKIEYNRVKSPNPNILIMTNEHVSAFKSTSPNKIDNNNEDDNNDKKHQIQKVLKRITFDKDPLAFDSKSPTPSNTVVNSPAIGSPFIGFKSLANDHCHLTNILNDCFFINNNNNNNGDIVQTPKSSGKRKTEFINCNNSEFDKDDEEEIDIILKQREVEKMILQEQQDYEYARKLHEELNRMDANNKKTYSLRTPNVKSATIKYSSTHSMVHRSGTSRKRQSTIDELCTRKKYKVQ